ncbi:LOW QUALITY PROTEIN: hypothetical protein ElyMa_006681600 [Elysia marginata]|uniref:Uncharacterized protein n=1 Tax=Elysia marginata TaxID=1093978 RepID=A0AAV4IMM2_9GAST|nr:LOW QUALITY PROTEIN: hypothetical protein ElyMa_006681600 [Elysia marginata]
MSREPVVYSYRRNERTKGNHSRCYYYYYSNKRSLAPAVITKPEVTTESELLAEHQDEDARAIGQVDHFTVVVVVVVVVVVIVVEEVVVVIVEVVVVIVVVVIIAVVVVAGGGD